MSETKRIVTPRGFVIYDEFTDSYGSRIRVQESSNAMGPHVWVFADHQRDHLPPGKRAALVAAGLDPEELAAFLTPSPHLTPDQAVRLRDALDHWLNEVQATLQAENLAAADLDD